MGRKKLSPGDVKVEVRMRVDMELHRRIEMAAKEEGNSVAAYIRAAIVRDLKRRKQS
jgi:predicted HicB family RNase H-like nuclease